MKNIKTNIIIIGFAALSLTSCKSLYGTYERPEVKADGIVRDPVNNQAILEGANDFGNLPWRSVFTDPNLQTIIERALNNNPNLLNAALNIDIAEQQLKAAKLSFLRFRRVRSTRNDYPFRLTHGSNQVLRAAYRSQLGHRPVRQVAQSEESNANGPDSDARLQSCCSDRLDLQYCESLLHLVNA